jgi:hypothetical protein
MTRRECNDLINPVVEKNIDTDEQRAGFVPGPGSRRRRQFRGRCLRSIFES